MGHLLNLFLSVFEVLFVVQASSIATDTLASTQSLSDDGSSLVSNNGRFEFGFFSPGSSKSRYLGLWYKNISQQTVVWVANRASPIADLSGRLMIDKAAGKLVIVNKNGTFQVWSSSSLRSTEAPILQLLNSGNLVLRDAKVEPSVSSSYLWQSFDYPSDTLLPEMKLGWDLKAGREWTITSWKNATDPSPGELVLRLENPYPEWYILKGAKKLTRGGPWNGLRYSGLPQLKANRIYTVDFVMNESGTYCIDHLTANSSATMRLVLNETVSQLVRYTWDAAQGSWQTLRSYPADPCDSYGSCGPYGICSSVDAPMCQCLEGFEPKVPDRWGAMDWSDGCVRMEPLNCSRKAEFRKFKGLKLPDTSNSWLNRSMNLKECATKCSSSCSCMAYTNSDIRGAGSGCATWTGDLLDMKLLAPGGQDLYIRMQFLEPDYNHILQIILPVSLSTLGFLLIIGYCIWKRRRRLTKNDRNIVNENELELPVLRLATIVKATCNFSPENKLGEGGFGPVYKGIRDDGQEIAVKKLSQTSFQGQIEFKNELILIAKLQHRNLVKLLGCCIEGSEKMLIYEYMPNRSLDHYIFDHTEGNLMSWVDCFRIISGIARGLLYLHQDSRLRIVHRDLKASNILLDDKMNPKISDFGLAKIFGGDQTEGRTKRVVGTHGYMAPEYMIHGRFSMKSDVFSFGVLVLELVTGKRNGGLVHHDCHLNLIGQAWALWQEGRPQNLMEGSSLESYDLVEVIRCIHIGLLCVQRHPDDRPSMSSVVLMLGSDSHHLPQPKQPAFITDQNVLDGKNLPSPGLATMEKWQALMDEALVDSYNIVQVERCIHIGLLCAQQSPEDRPSMSSVVLMLYYHSAVIRSMESREHN